MREKKTTSKCHLLKILYRALSAKTFNLSKESDYHDCSVKMLGFTKYNINHVNSFENTKLSQL